MDRSVAKLFESFLDRMQSEEQFSIYDFIEYVKNRYPRKTPSTTTVSCLCRRSERCVSTEEQGVYVMA